MVNNRYEKIVATMVAEKTETTSKRFKVSINGVDQYLNLISVVEGSDYIFKSELDGTEHRFIHIPPFHRKYHTNGKKEYIFKEEY